MTKVYFSLQMLDFNTYMMRLFMPILQIQTASNFLLLELITTMHRIKKLIMGTLAIY